MVRLFTRRRARDKGARHASSGLPAPSAGAQAICLGGPAGAGEGARNLVALKAGGVALLAQRPAPSCGGGQGWGVARTEEIVGCATAPLSRRTARPPSLVLPHKGEETRRDDPRTNSRAKGARRGHRST